MIGFEPGITGRKSGVFWVDGMGLTRTGVEACESILSLFTPFVGLLGVNELDADGCTAEPGADCELTAVKPPELTAVKPDAAAGRGCSLGVDG